MIVRIKVGSETFCMKTQYTINCGSLAVISVFFAKLKDQLVNCKITCSRAPKHETNTHRQKAARPRNTNK